MDLYILLDPVTNFWKCPQRGFCYYFCFGIFFTKVVGLREAIMEEKQLICGNCLYGGGGPPYDSSNTRGVLFFLTQGLQSHVVSMEEEEQYCPLW